MSQYLDVEKTLDAWRAAERRIAESRPGSAERAAAKAEADRLREDYHSLTDAPDSAVTDGAAPNPEMATKPH
jgi:hypothetical protein